jgi:predicted ribosome quality control (RQC) complex YloA/Tae2 family protein
MIAHYFTLEALAAELRAGLTGAVLEEIYTQSKDELLFTLTTRGGGERTLVISVASGMNALFARDGRMRAKRNSTDIFPGAFGSSVSWISVDRFSRVVVIEAGAFRLRAHLFNNTTANVFLLDNNGVVVSAFTNAGEFEGRPYQQVGNRGDLPDPLDAGKFRASLTRSEVPLDRAVKSSFPWLGPLYHREVFHRAGVDGGIPARDADDAASDALASAAAALLGEAREPSPRLYAGVDEDRNILSVVELRHAGRSPIRIFPSVNDGVRECFSSRRRETGLDDEKAGLLEALGRERKKVEKSLKEAKSRAEDATAAERHRKTGTLILTHLHLIRRGETEVRLADPEGGEVAVKLDRALTPAANANLYFDKARKAETAREENETRIGVLAAKLENLEGLLREVNACDDAKEVRDIQKRMRSGKGAPIAMDGGERLPYRVFPIGEKYEAWVGKSSSDNDVLTFKHAGQHDYWMHVRGSPGSHVVLRSRSGGAFDPPKEAIRAAAKIAAYYSKMKKAGMVPVAYCQRKYVKKPKNAPPGTVTLQREEVIFVEPGLP